MTLNTQSITSEGFPRGLIKHRLKSWLMWLLILSSLSGGGYLVYRQTVTSSLTEARSKIQTISVGRETLPITISANGAVEAKQSTNVSPKSSGRLKTLLVDEGDSVSSGQVLAYMDDLNLQGQLIQAQGALASAQANLKKATAGNRPQDIASAQAQLNRSPSKFTKSTSR